MLKKVLLITLLVCCCAPLFAQYKTDYSFGLTDGSTYLPTTNAWKVLPTKASISMTSDQAGNIYVLDTAGCAWKYDYSNRTYAQQTVWGCGWSEISLLYRPDLNQPLANLLKTDSRCSTWPGTKRWYQAGLSDAPFDNLGCVQHIAGGSDGSFLEMGYHGSATNFFNDGTTLYSISGSFFGASIWDKQNVCAVQSDIVGTSNIGRIYTISGTTMHVMSAQPSFPPPGKGFGGATSCQINSEGIFATNGTLVFFYDFTKPNPVWTSILSSGVISSING